MRGLWRWGMGLFIFAASAAWGEMPEGEYLAGKGSTVGVLLAHGQGADPDSAVVGHLRRAINRELGYHTLSLQMPVLPGAKSPERFREYVSTFPEAFKIIQAGIDFLRKEHGVTRFYLMGYSMGGRMTTAFLVQHPESGVVGYIGVGLLGGGDEPLNTNLNLQKISLPVLDIFADSGPDTKSAEFRKPLLSERFVQVALPGARHDYSGYEDQIAATVTAWLKKQEAVK